MKEGMREKRGPKEKASGEDIFANRGEKKEEVREVEEYQGKGKSFVSD